MHLGNRDFWTGRRVLVTGHTGFKGSWLALWLSELGAKVTGVSLKPETSPSLFGQLDLEKRLAGHHLADIRHSQAISEIAQTCQPQVVFHLAAQPLVRRSYSDPMGTWSTNVLGSLHVLEALKPLQHKCAVVMVTTDKVYENQEWDYGYRETDRLGGHDPYSASKAAAELAIASWRSSFCGAQAHQNPNLAIATARAGNVIGGGDWAEDRIIPDAMRALAAKDVLTIRNPGATRPWQHVLEPLGGYLCLAEALHAYQPNIGQPNPFCAAFNFGPLLEANKSVSQLIEATFQHWPGEMGIHCGKEAVHEAARLHLQIDKARHRLGWAPRWTFETTIQRTVDWYQSVHGGSSPINCCLSDINAYENID